EEGKFEEYYVQLSAIVRRYLEDGFHVRAPEMTTEEFLAAATSDGRLIATHRRLLGEFLSQADLVKFARHLPTLKDSEAAYDAARRWRWVLHALRGLALLLLVVALARPQKGKAESAYHGEGIDIVLAVDISGSMLSEDFTLGSQRASRLDVVKSVVKDFVAARDGDRIGLVLFSARAYTQCPLTLDHGWLLQNLARAHIGMIEDGTAIGS